MSIDTGLSVPVFNVLKYFVISVILEAIVRTSLDNLNIFFRARDLYLGRPVSLNPSRIDRYSLSSLIRLRKIPTLFFSLALACCAYGIEILLEFSSTAEANEYPISGRLDLYHPTHRACTPMQLDFENTMDRIDDMATTCVVLTEKKYTFYDVSWQRQDGNAPTALCVHSRSNILHKGDRIFKVDASRNVSEEEKAVISFTDKLVAHSWQFNGTLAKSTVLIRLTNADVTSTSSYAVGEKNYTRAVLASHLSNATIQCVGTIFGRHGHGIMSARVHGCFGNMSDGLHYTTAIGTSVVKADAKHIDSQPWNTVVAMRPVMKITNFTTGVFENGDMERFRALSILFSAGEGKDMDLINKYAVVYKHCSDYFVPKSSDISRTQYFGKAESERKITVAVAEWALVILLVWPLLLSLTSLGSHLWGKRKHFPRNVHGEGDMAQRWLSRSSRITLGVGKQPMPQEKKLSSVMCREWFKWLIQPTKAFLNVKIGETFDDIVVGSIALCVDRKPSHPFKKLG